VTHQTNEAFAASTPQWWSLAAQWLRWRPSEFWGATPAELIGALREPQVHAGLAPPNREKIAQMLERENDG